ncbi:MAG: PucR family transcriptional regulator ligand-binding domain-containing protein [Anaerovoracaceae bacterium]
MLTVMELLSHPQFSDFRLITDKSGLQNKVLNSGIFEWEQGKQIQENFQKGDFIMTTLSPYNNNRAQAEFFVKRLIDRRPCAIAIKEIYFSAFSKDVVDYANNKNVPIFFFTDTFFDDIVFAIKSTLTPKEINIASMQTLRKILYEDHTPFRIEILAKEINQFFQNQLICAFALPRDTESEETVLNYFEDSYNKSIRMFKAPNKAAYSVIKFPKGICIIYTNSDALANLPKETNLLIDNLPIDKSLFSIGFSQIYDSLTEIGIAFRESVYSAVDAKIDNIQNKKFEDIGFSQFLCPLRNTPWVKNYFDSKVNLLLNYDQMHNAHIFETAVSFIKNNCNYNATGESLFQHSNTVRYRINKALQILGIKNSLDAYGQLSLIVRQSEINKILHGLKI